MQRRLPNGQFSDNFYALKFSWPLKSRVSEIDIIKHLKNALPESSHDHLPELFFSRTWTAEELKLPWLDLGLSLSEENHQDRVLRGLAATYYKKLWEAGSITNFKQAWLDCVECELFGQYAHAFQYSPPSLPVCYLVYRIGRVLHRDISENNLMLLSKPDGKAKGVLNDWDMAKFIHHQEQGILAGHHRTGTPPFMAIDLVEVSPVPMTEGQPLPPAPPHWLRHELESLFYILVWAALHYNLSLGTRDPEVHPLIASWTDVQRNAEAKTRYLMGAPKEDREVQQHAKEEFKSLVGEWIVPLRKLWGRALFFGRDNEEHSALATYSGHLTFKAFMQAIKVEPRTWGLPESFLEEEV